MTDLTAYTVGPQSYGLAMAQCTFGGPSGVWLNCFGGCFGGGKLRGPDPQSLTDDEALEIFRREGWREQSRGRFICPACAKAQESDND